MRDFDEKSGRTGGTALLQKACDLIDYVGSSEKALTATELLQATNLPRATFYRIVKALTERGLLRYGLANQSIELGFHFVELAQNLWSSSGLASVAAGEIRRLRDMTGETTYVAVLQDASARILGRFEGGHTLRSSAAVGLDRPLHCTSQGKAMLSYMSEKKVRSLLGDTLEPRTVKTLTTFQHLLADLEVSRARGFAIDDEEIVPLRRCVGAAILDDEGQPIAAISVAGPSFRMTPRRTELLGPEVKSAADKISYEINRARLPTISLPDTRPESSPRGFFGACALWDWRTSELVWIDRMAPAVHWETSNGAVTRPLQELGRKVDAAVLCAEGLALFAANELIILNKERIIRREPIANDKEITAARVHPNGTPWLASWDAHVQETRVGPLGKQNEGFSLGGVVTDFAFSSAEKCIYAAIPERQSIMRLGLSDGRKQVFCRVPEGAGRPTALAIGEQGLLWVALQEGWSVVKLDAEGEFDKILPLPVPAPTSVAFGGLSVSRIFITSDRTGLSSDALSNAPLSGMLISINNDEEGTREKIANI